MSTESPVSGTTPAPRHSPPETAASMADRRLRLQPPLHELVVVVAAPTCLLSAPSGDVDALGADSTAHGLFHADVRLLSVARLSIGGTTPSPVLGVTDGPGRARFVGLARHLGDAAAADATVRIDRRRSVQPGRLVEEITVTSTAREHVDTELALVNEQSICRRIAFEKRDCAFNAADSTDK